MFDTLFGHRVYRDFSLTFEVPKEAKMSTAVLL